MTLTKGQKNQKNEDQIEKNIYIINLDWMMKFKTHRNCTKGSRKKIINKNKLGPNWKKIIYHKLRLKDETENK